MMARRGALREPFSAESIEPPCGAAGSAPAQTRLQADGSRARLNAMTADAPRRPKPPTLPLPKYDAGAFAVRAARAAHDRHAEDVVVLDLRGLSPVADYFVVCSGTSDRQMRAVHDAIVADGAAMGCRPFGSAGRDSCTWMLLDFVDVVVHVFAPEYRRYYDLEMLWDDAPRIDWNEQPTPGAGGPSRGG